MKKVNIKIAGLALLASFGFASCSDAFLEEKINYDQAGATIYNDYDGALGRLSDIYGLCMPDMNGNPSWQYNSTGLMDDLSKCTEEYSGFGVFVNPEKELNTTSGTEQPDFFMGDASNVRNNAWGLIRNINDAIIGIDGGSLSQEQKNELLGQLYFFRAWRYFSLVKWYGGVPIIKDLQPFEPESIVPRSTTKECVEFIIDDLNKAASMLEPFTGAGQWLSGKNYGRVTMATALALKGRVLTWWCSPLFNRQNDVERYKAAYTEMVADLEKISAAGHKLARADGDGNGIVEWANMFVDAFGAKGVDRSSIVEGVFVVRYNTLDGGVPDYHRNNPWEQKVRPSNCYGGGGITPSAMIVDMFPMGDGGVPQNAYFASSKLRKSSIAYDEEHPFIFRDNRFYRTFGFPGVRWQYSGDATSSEKMYPYNGNDYQLWNYVWYEKAEDVASLTTSKEYGADALEGSVKGVYVVKRSNGNSFDHYAFKGYAEKGAGFKFSGATYMEIRYAEVLLNLAEVAVGAGEYEHAYDLLKDIRIRAGYRAGTWYNDNGDDYTVPEDLGLMNTTDPGTAMAQVLYERQIELAFEGKRFDDMRRWLLFDGGVGFDTMANVPSTWKLNGAWGGNTCQWLGVEPLNGKRRENMVFQVKPTINNGIGGKEWPKGQWDKMPDPLADQALAEGKIAEKTWVAFKTWRNAMAVDFNALKRHQTEQNKKVDKKLADLRDNFYVPYLQRKLKRGDGRDSNNDLLQVNFLPRYYFLGLSRNAQTKNQTLPQNIGWEDYISGGEGTFDPLAE